MFQLRRPSLAGTVLCYGCMTALLREPIGQWANRWPRTARRVLSERALMLFRIGPASAGSDTLSRRERLSTDPGPTPDPDPPGCLPGDSDYVKSQLAALARALAEPPIVLTGRLPGEPTK